MAHATQQLLEAVVALLEQPATAWKIVFATRLPTSRAVMPYLLAFVDEEALTAIDTAGPGIYQRDAGLVVAGRLRLPGNNDTETVEERMNALADELETRLTFAAIQAALPQLQRLHYTGIERTVVVNDDDTPQYAEVTVSLTARLITAEGAPDTLL